MIVKSELLLLDGATGTELNRRGVDTGLPLWSANALTSDTGLNVLRQIHLDYQPPFPRPPDRPPALPSAFTPKANS